MELIDIGRAATVVKTRIMAGGRTLARLDRGDASPPAFGRCDADRLRDRLRGASGVLASDYGLGILGLPVMPGSARGHPEGSCPSSGIRIPAGRARSPAPRSSRPTRTRPPSSPEIPAGGLDGSIQQARRLAQIWDCDSVAVTRGGRGVTLAGRDGLPRIVPVDRVDDADTCGAGDAFAAAAAAALAEGEDVGLAVELAVARAGPLRPAGSGLRATGHPAPSSTRWGSRERRASDVAARVRAAGGTVVLAGGCFDLLHAGHVAYLQAARNLGDCLIVALNSDSSVRGLKGPDRPLMRAEDRIRVLEALRCVDAVEVFHESTPPAVIERLRPHVFAKGGDYTEASVPEASLVRALGGQVVLLPLLSGRSSTRLVEAARGAGPQDEEEESCADPRTA